MVIQNYQQLIEKIAKASGLTVSDIERRVEAKCAKLSGLISKEGSAQIVASELGISFEKEKMKVSELVSGMKRVNVIGKIINLNPIREYNKNGKSGKIASMSLADETGNVRLVLWDINHISLFEENKINEGDFVEISNGTIRNGELHLSGFSDIRISREVIPEVKTEKSFAERKLVDLKSGENAKLRAIVTQVFEPKFFEVCPECGKKAVNANCEAHGTIIPKKRALVGLVLDDGTENMRGVMFNDQLNAIGISDEDLENPEFFIRKREELLGKEAMFSVGARSNKLFGTTELNINKIEEIELDKLIESLKVNN